MSFFILCDGKKSKNSVETLCKAIEEAGFACQSSFDKQELKAHLKADYIVLFLTKHCLRDKDLVNKFIMTTSKKKKYCIVFEADQNNGAEISKGDLAIIDLDSIVKDPKSVPKARKALGEVSAIPYRVNKSFSDFCVQRILHCFCLKTLKETMCLSSDLQNIDISEKDVSESVKEIFGNLEKAPTKTNINFIGCEAQTSEFLFSNKLITDLKDKVAVASHNFDQHAIGSLRAQVCLENIAKQLFHQIPDYNLGFCLPHYTVEQYFLELFLKPCKKILRRKHFAFLIFRNIDKCERFGANSLLHLLQNMTLPNWIRVIVTGSKDFCSQYKLDKPTINLILEEKTQYDDGLRLQEFKQCLAPNIDTNKLLGLCSLSKNPIPVSILSKVLKQDLSSLNENLNKFEVVEVITHKNGQENYIKLSNWDEIEKVSNLDLIAIIKETISTSKLEHELEYAFKELLYQLIDAGDVETFDRYVTSPIWVFDRLKYGVSSLIEQMRYALSHSSQNGLNTKFVHSFLRFLQNAEGVLYRDSREYLSQMLGHFVSSLDKKIIAAVKNIDLEGQKSFLPLKATLRSDNAVLGNVSFDSFIEKQPYVRVVVSKQVEEFICCGTDDGQVIVYAANELDFKRIKSFNYHNRVIKSIANQKDTVLTTSDDCTAILFSIRTGKILHSFNKAFCRPPIGGYFGTNCFNIATKSVFRVFDSNYALKQEIPYKRASCMTELFTKKYTCALGFSNGTIALVPNSEAIKLENISERSHSRGIISMCCQTTNPDILVSVGFDRQIKIWDLNTLTILTSFQPKITPVTNILVQNDKIVASSIEITDIQVFDFDGEEVRVLYASGFGCESMCSVGKDNLFVAGTDYLKQIQPLENTQEKSNINPIEFHEDWIKSIAVSTSSSEVATGDISGGIVIWDSNTGEHKRSLKCESYVGNLFVFSMDGKYLLSRVGAWDAKTGLRVPYMSIAKSNRHPLKNDFEYKKLNGYLNLLEIKDGICFSADSPDSVFRAKLPVTEFRKAEIAMCCSGRKVHFLEIV